MKRTLSFILGIILIFSLTSVIAFADIGPKPSVVITIKGLEGQNYYVTLLSRQQSTGPYSAYEPALDYSARYSPEDEEYEIWRKLVEYEDSDGFYFLQYFKNCSETNQFSWTYYPPAEFKVLIYFPQQDRYIVSSEVYERYAFDSHYQMTVDAGALQNITTHQEVITVTKDYRYGWEVVSLMTRIVATIAIELLIALVFGYRRKPQLQLILLVNVCTQVLLNVLLNVINYNLGSMAFVFNYVWMELLVFAIEAMIYSKYLNRGEILIKSWKPPVYALVANAVSFIGGMALAIFIPGIF